MTSTFRLSDLYLIKKETIVTGFLYTGMLIAFLGSLNPWFMWPIGGLYPIPAAGCLLVAFLLSRTMKQSYFSRTDFILPLVTFLLFSIYERISTESNLNGYLMLVFRATIFFCIFTVDTEKLRELTTFICKVMGGLLAVSLAGHLLYLTGFSLPGKDASFGEFYTYTNHYLFLLDDRNLFTILPRFNSYFLEPSHIGSSAAFLLFAQRGQWWKWYNIVLLTTIFFTFSLAAYIYIVAIIFLNLWITKKQFFGKFIAALGLLGGATLFASTYNEGDNPINELIMLRLEVNDDGKLAGDARVTNNFEADYANFVESSDIFLGRDYEITEFGNAGYKVFFYDHGIVGIILLTMFYIVSMAYSPNKRAVIATLIVATLYFLPSAFMLWENIFLPLYAAAYLDSSASSQDSIETGNEQT